MSTHTIGFYEDLTKIYFYYHQISSNTHPISCSGPALLYKSRVRMSLKKQNTSTEYKFY